MARRGRYGPNVLISLVLLVLDLAAFFVLVSSRRQHTPVRVKRRPASQASRRWQGRLNC